MNQEKRALLAASLSLLILFGWLFLFGPKQSPVKSGQPLSAAVEPPLRLSTPSPEGSPSKKPVEGISKKTFLKGVPEETSRWEGDTSILEWTNRGGRLKTALMKGYREGVEKNSPLINLISSSEEEALSLVCQDCSTDLPLDEDYQLVAQTGNSLTYRGENEALLVEKTYSWQKGNPLVELKVSLRNKSGKDFHGRVGLEWLAKQPPKKEGGSLSFLKRPQPGRSFLYRNGQEVFREKPVSQAKEIIGGLEWVGIEDRYFLISLISRQVSSETLLKMQQDSEKLLLEFFPAPVTVMPASSSESLFSFYVGPKDRELLRTAGASLEEAVDYGKLSWIAIPILKLLQIFQRLIGNWGLSVIVLTLFVKLLMNPLTIRSMKQMKGMQKLQPQLAALKEKYANDKQRLNTETMQLFKTHKVNPMGGCLPMILQMPIYIALYKVLYNAIELYHAPFFGFYRDLSGPDPYFILPILLGVAMVAQQKISPSASADPVQKQMMMIMPIMFTSFMLFLPLGLVLYIFVNTTTSLLQQWMYQKDIRWRDLFRRPQAL